jgi:hypothetical protein
MWYLEGGDTLRTTYDLPAAGRMVSGIPHVGPPYTTYDLANTILGKEIAVSQKGGSKEPARLSVPCPTVQLT